MTDFAWHCIKIVLIVIGTIYYVYQYKGGDLADKCFVAVFGTIIYFGFIVFICLIL